MEVVILFCHLASVSSPCLEDWDCKERKKYGWMDGWMGRRARNLRFDFVSVGAVAFAVSIEVVEGFLTERSRSVGLAMNVSFISK